MIKDYKNLLPVGSVVVLKDGIKKIFITGFLMQHNDKRYDYSGFLYPEGMLKSDELLLFNHDQIDKVYFNGYVDGEEISFKEKLNDINIVE